MLIFKLMSLVTGYVTVRMRAANFEKVMNLLRKKGISIWEVERKEDNIKFKMSYEDYKKYADLVKKTKMEPVEKKGLVYNLTKLKVRKGFVLGLLALVISLYVITSLIWNIQVVGANNTTAKNIIKVLEKNNIKTPISHSNIQPKHLETLLYKNFDNFKFVEVYVEGSNLIIFVREKEIEKADIKKTDPTSIISTKNAIINKVIAKSGQPVVKEGDVVYEGQTLVMGIVKNKNSEEFMMVPSDGIIYGKTYYNFEIREAKLKEVEVSTNKSKSVYYLHLNGKSNKILSDKSPFENYNYRERTVSIPILSDLTGISIIKGTYYEYVLETVNIDEDTAKNSLTIGMYDDLLKKCGKDAKIVKSSLNFSDDDQYYYLRSQIEIIEDIGTKVKIYPTQETEQKETTEDNQED